MSSLARSHRLAMLALSVIAFVACAAPAKAAEAISLDKFRDGIKHWRDGADREQYPAYKTEQYREIADNLLLYQRANGGWPKNFDPLRILDNAERTKVVGQHDQEDTTFDNRATYPVVEYLAEAFERSGEERYRKACERGLEFILRAQYENGGWPHSFPASKGYYPQITIVDDVMTGVLTTLGAIAAGEPQYKFLEPSLRERVVTAHRRGDECLLRLQVVVDGRPTGWAAQYDRVTLEPCQGRSFELPALISSETVTVLRYLMRIDQPDERVRRAIESGAEWLSRSRIMGLRVDRVDAEAVRYQNHTSRYDVVAIEDPAAGPIWARFYEIETNRPFMANRDGRKVYKLADVERERRTGYGWYTGSPAHFLEREYPAWRRKWMDDASPK